MGRITELRLRNVRCFDGEQSAKLGRITLLLGEHGAGKSTFLGCYKTLAKLANLSVERERDTYEDLDDANHFDDKPFYMGPFDTIVRSGKADFAVGGSFESHCHTGATFTFAAGEDAAPVNRKVQLEFNGTGNRKTRLDIEWLREPAALRFKGPDFRFDLDRSEISYASISTWLSRYARRGILPFHGEPSDFRRRSGLRGSRDNEVEFGKFVSFLRSELPLPGKPSFAVEAFDPALPPRKRAYVSPPAHLGAGRDSDLRYLAEVGKNLGLWDAISVRSNPEDGTFEVLIGTPSGWRNLVDVGYGVHGLLLLLHKMHRRERGAVFLLQQPEVHLHPSAQANLAQFMAESDRGFLIETHSEHFTDRFRICVMEGTLRPEELSVVYFEPSSDGRSSRIHSMEVDASANLLNVPNSYRSFFLRETERLLGFQE